MNIKIGRKIFFIPNILILLSVGLIVRLLFLWFGTLKLDHGTFVAWSNSLLKDGFKHFYFGWSDYFPGYLYILWLLAKIESIIPVSTIFLYKLPAIIADLVSGYLIYKIVSKQKKNKLGLILSGLYFFNPAILANSTFWGQVDSLTSLFSLLVIYFLDINLFLSAVSLAIGTLIKPQLAFIAIIPILFFIKEKIKVWKIVKYVTASGIVFLLGFIPFWNEGSFWNFLIKRFGISLGQYPYSSVNAYNFWGLFGFWKPDNKPFPLIYLGLGLVVIILALVLIKTWKKEIWKGETWRYLVAAIIFSSTFLFLPRMHERHLLPALAPLLISAGIFSDLLIPYIFMSVTYLANLIFAYTWVSYDFLEIFPPFLNKVFILINIFSLGFILVRVIKNRKIELLNKFSEFVSRWVKSFKNPNKDSLLRVDQFPRVNLSSRKSKLVLTGIILFALFSRLIFLWSPEKEYFDEVYHAFTARIIMHGDPKAWEWWNPHPQGFAYEWTHPPLAKLGMVVGMKIFGENSFGWRFPGALLGVGSIILVYLLSKKLFKDEALALTASAILSLDGLMLVANRIGMNDSYLLFFALLTIYLFFKKKDLPAAICFGLALSSKWSALWIIPILGVLWLKREKKFSFSLLWFFILPPLVYLASYIPMFLTGHDFGTFWGMQKQMWWYHTGLRATHPYTSPWWNWPLLVRPIYLYTSNEVGGMVSRIYAMGNPLIFWFGFGSVIYLVIKSLIVKLSNLKKRMLFASGNLGIVLFAYFVFFAPWALSPRIMFLYHYLPSVPFLAMAIAYLLRKNPKYILSFLISALIFFVYFFPHWTGINIPIWLDMSYYWFNSWR